jgi:TPR repeat protein
VAAQFVVGLAHLGGYCIEKNGHFAYYWLRMAAENSSEVQQRSARLVEKLKTKITRADRNFTDLPGIASIDDRPYVMLTTASSSVCTESPANKATVHGRPRH